MKKITFFLLIFISQSIIFGQNTKLKIHSKLESDTLLIQSIFLDEQMHNFSFNDLPYVKIPIIKNYAEFTFNLKDIHPFIIMDKGFVSDFIFLNEGDNLITVDQINKKILIDNKYQNEYNIMKEKLINTSLLNFELVGETNMNKLKDINDEILQKYIEQNAQSKVAFYYLAADILAFGKTNSKIKQSLESFEREIKDTQDYKYVLNKLKTLSDKDFFIKNSLKLKNIALKQEDLPIKESALKNDFTLLDFWFSSCEPCIRQFPQLLKIFNIYRNKGFNILGVSVDETNKINKWKKIINDKNLSWPQYLDENGMNSKKNNIVIFPTNFLINKSGKIIAKDITPEELEKFLEENLKK